MKVRLGGTRMRFLKKLFRQAGEEELDQAWLAYTLEELQAMGYAQDVPQLLPDQILGKSGRGFYAN